MRHGATPYGKLASERKIRGPLERVFALAVF
jgi:hypothetical protein